MRIRENTDSGVSAVNVDKPRIEPTFHPLGEQAVIVSFGDRPDARVARLRVRFMRVVAARAFPGYQECVPSAAAVCIYFDLFAVAEWLTAASSAVRPYEAVCGWLRERLLEVYSSPEERENAGRTVRIAVCYCAACALDLGDVAARSGLTEREVVQIHTGSEYTVSMIGFLPGFPYLDGLSGRLIASRMASPRKYVPAGSVAIAGRQTGIYPSPSPGGWRVIGRTSAPLFDESRYPPSLLSAGDSVVFEAVSHDAIGR